MKVLVTGGAGFIGSHIVEKLLAHNYEVSIVDNLSTGLQENIHKDAAFFQMDIRSSELAALFAQKKFDMVIHLAAQTMVPKSLNDPYYDCDVNILGIVNVLEACRKHNVKRVIFPSSAAVYGDLADIPLTEELAAKAQLCSFYALSKMTSERYLAMYQAVYGLEYVVLRYANVYGERQGDSGEGGVVSIFARKARGGQSIVIFGDGGQTRDFIYAGDVAEANCQALITKSPNRVYNISTMQETSVNDLALHMEKVSGHTLKKEYQAPRQGDIYRSCLSNEAAEQLLDWAPKMPLAEGLLRTYQALVK
ncbi:MAG: NAD-dependent epimerase/dehydratase family protein [Pelosinus sp.]|nr:NAD-dependent epimerase/dehydratase family protein [Pelosinus sp.]